MENELKSVERCIGNNRHSDKNKNYRIQLKLKKESKNLENIEIFLIFQLQP